MGSENGYSPVQELSLTVENVDLRLLIDSVWETEEPRQILLHNHISTELFVCGKGSVTLKTETGHIQLFPGDAAVIPPHVFHLKDQVQPQTEGYAISFLCKRRSTRDSSNLYRQLHPFVSGTQILVYRNRPLIFDGVQTIVKEAGQTDPWRPILHLTALLLQMLDYPYTTEGKSDPTTPADRQNTDIQRMMELDKLITKACQSDWNNRTIAALLCISPRQLNRIVLKRYGKTLHQVILDRRMETAEQLLRTTNTPVEEIASLVGFGSSSGLYREFKRRYAVTPAKYREVYK